MNGRNRRIRCWLTLLSSLASTVFVCSAVAADSPDPAGAEGVWAAPALQECPPGQAPGSRCLSGRDSAGAYYWLAVPPDWNGILVLHAHGGPELGEPKAERAAADLARWSIWTRSGYAYAGSGFHRGGVAVRSAAADTERVRRIFVARIGQPKLTVLHGQSWGAGVAVKAAEMFGGTQDGKPRYDALLLSSGVLGGTQSYNFRLDLRVVYQALCANHPRPDEPAYPLWQGLPAGSTLSRIELAARVDECTGVHRKKEQRSPAQQRRLDTLVNVISIPQSSLLGHMNWATWHFQDLALHRLDGRNPFANENVRYRGSPDDNALNAKVARYRADPLALAAFAADADAQGHISVPVLTLHASRDPTAFVELESFFRDKMSSAGHAENLLQVFTSDTGHSYLTDAQYVAAMRSLIEWTASGHKPSAADVADRCQALEAVFEPAAGCHFLPEFEPNALSSRVAPR